MKFTIRIVMIVALLLLIFAGVACSSSSRGWDGGDGTNPENSGGLTPQPQSSTDSDSTETSAPYVVPGPSSINITFQGVIDWIAAEQGILPTDPPFDLSTYLDGDRADKHFKDYDVVKMGDGSIIGCVTFQTAQSVKHTDAGDVIVGEGYDYLNEIVTDITDTERAEPYVDAWRHSGFFIIANEEKVQTLIGFYMRCMEGWYPDKD